MHPRQYEANTNISINQQDVLDKLRIFLGEDAAKRLPEPGYCFGFSIARAVMRRQGYLHWWESVLKQIALWDGKTATLHAEWNNIFKFVINLLTHYQACIKDSESVATQHNFLLPNGDFGRFQFGHIPLEIKSNHRMGGHLSVEDIVLSIIDKTTTDAISNNICVVVNLSHACELSCSEQIRDDGSVQIVWEFYCPNHGNAKSFVDPYALAREIIRVLGNDFVIELACLNDCKQEPFSYYYNELINKQTRKILAETGLQVITLKMPSFIPSIIRSLKRSANSTPLDLNRLGNNTIISHLAIEAGDTKSLETLYLHGAEIDQTAPTFDITPLMHAANRKDSNMVLTLCACGADPNKQNSSKWTALHSAAILGDVQSINILCGFGANPDSETMTGYTPLMLAAIHNHSKAIIALHNYGAKLDVTTIESRTAMILAAEHGSNAAIKTLHALGVSPNQSDVKGMTPLMLASISNQPTSVTTLIQLGAELNQFDSSNNSALMIAAYVDLNEVVSELLLAYSRANREIELPTMFLTELAEEKGIVFNSFLFCNTDDVSLPTTFHLFSPLELAAYFGCTLILPTLLENVPVNTKMLDKLEAIAKTMNQYDVITFLRTHAAKLNTDNKFPHPQAAPIFSSTYDGDGDRLDIFGMFASSSFDFNEQPSLSNDQDDDQLYVPPEAKRRKFL